MDIDTAVSSVAVANQIRLLNQEIASIKLAIAHKKTEIDAKLRDIQKVQNTYNKSVRIYFEVMSDKMLQEYVASGRTHAATARRILNTRTAEVQRIERAASRIRLTPGLPILPSDAESEYWRD